MSKPDFSGFARPTPTDAGDLESQMASKIPAPTRLRKPEQEPRLKLADPPDASQAPADTGDDTGDDTGEGARFAAGGAAETAADQGTVDTAAGVLVDAAAAVTRTENLRDPADGGPRQQDAARARSKSAQAGLDLATSPQLRPPAERLSEAKLPTTPFAAAAPGSSRAVQAGSGVAASSRRSLLEIAAEREEAKLAAQVADRVLSVVDRTGQSVRVAGAEMDSSLVKVTLAADDVQVGRVVDAMPDLVRLFDVADIDAEIGDGFITLWVPARLDDRGTQKSMWVPLALRDRLRQYQEATGQTATQVVLGAFNACYDQLDALFPRSPQLPADGPMRFSDAKTRRGLDTGVQIWVRLKPHQLAAIDAAVRATGAGSRSAFVSVLLDQALPRDNASHAPLS